MNKSIVGAIMILIGGFNFLLFVAYVLSAGLAKLTQEERLLGLGTGGLVVLGIILVLMGGRAARKREEKAITIHQRGIETEAVVTYVDKNFSVTVNDQPIYSTIEFKFKVGATDYTGRKERVPSELAIRNRIEVGGRVRVKYLPEDPNQTILVLPDAAQAAAKLPPP